MLASALLAVVGNAVAEVAEPPSTPQPSSTARPPIPLIEDPRVQAKAWAACAASYNVYSELLLAGGDEAQSEHIAELGNGAELAVGVALLDISTLGDREGDRITLLFRNRWSFSQLAMETWPQSEETAIRARFEAAANEDRFDEALSSLADDIRRCVDALPAQQMYIDFFRSMIMDGLLQMPEE